MDLLAPATLFLSEPPAVGTMPALLDAASAIVTNGIAWLVKVVQAVAANQLLLLFVILPLVGLGIGLFRRLINVQ